MMSLDRAKRTAMGKMVDKVHFDSTTSRYSSIAAHEYIRKYGFPRKESISPKHPAYEVLCESPFVAI